MRSAISRDRAFLGLLRLIVGAFSERLRPQQDTQPMSSQPSPTASRQIVWPSVVTLISAAILIGAEVFGAAFAGGWALAIVMPPETFGLPISHETWAHVLQAVLFAAGVFVMVVFIRTAQSVEPFTRRA